MDPPCRG
jgi:hypothetical protein